MTTLLAALADRAKLAFMSVEALCLAAFTARGRAHVKAGKDLVDLIPGFAELADRVWPIRR